MYIHGPCTTHATVASAVYPDFPPPFHPSLLSHPFLYPSFFLQPACQLEFPSYISFPGC